MVPSATIASWFQETLTKANIKASGDSTRKAAITYVGSQGASIKTIMEAGDWLILCFHDVWPLQLYLPRQIPRETASSQGVDVARITADIPPVDMFREGADSQGKKKE